MPVDFSLLDSKQPLGHAVATLPQQPNALDSFGNNLMKGLQEGQSVAASMQQVAASKQDMQEKSQLFPSLLQEQQAKAKGESAVADLKQNALDKVNQQDAAFKQSFNQGMAAVKQTDPVKFYQIQEGIDKHSEAIQDISKKATESKEEALKYGTQLASIAGSINQNAAAAEANKPGSGDQVYQQQLKMMGPENASIMPAHWDPVVTNHILAYTGHAAMVSAANESIMKNGTPEMKDASVMGPLKTKIDNGTATTDEKNTYDQMQSQLDSKKSSETKPVTTLLTGSQGQKDFFNLRTLDRGLSNSISTLNTLSSQLNAMPSSRLNPVTGKVNEKFDAQTEAVSKNLNTLVLQAPALFGMSGSALRLGSVWNLIQKSKPSPEMWMVANKAMVADLKYAAAIQAQKSWQDESEQMKAQALSGNKQAVAESQMWLKDHPEPMKTIARPDLTDFYKLFPAAKGQLEADWDKIGGTPLNSSQSNAGDLKVGAVHVDANGNKATFLGGDPKDIKSWKTQ